MNVTTIVESLAPVFLTLMHSPDVKWQAIVLTGGWCFYNQVYDPTRPEVARLTYDSGLKPHYAPTATKVADKTYVIGGWSYEWPLQFRSDVQVYSIRTNTTTQGTRMHTPRVLHTAVTDDDAQVFVCGGMNGWGASFHLSSCATYNTQSQQWTDITDMPTRRVDHVSAYLNGKIYVAAGVENGEYTNTAMVYDTKEKKWNYVAPMLNYRDVPASAVTPDGQWLVCGGYDGINGVTLTSCESYNPSTNKWTYVAPLQIGRYGFQMVYLHNKLYVLGGMGGVNPAWLGSVEQYDPKTGSNLIDADLAAVCTGFAAFSVE